MRKMIGLFIVLACCVAVSSAQQSTPVALDKWDVFTGYSFSRAYLANEPGVFPMNLNGGQGAITYNFTRHFGATTEFAGYTNDVEDTTIHTMGYLFGPSARFGPKNSRINFFAHQLFGVTHFLLEADPSTDCTVDCSITTNSFTMVTGGGIDVKLSKHLSIRPIQMEYFTQQLSLDSFESPLAVRATARPMTSVGGTGIKLSSNGFRYSAGAVFRF